jgi:anaerobic magnesium-protoporphyrin IX monomethyl ester cyclase
VIDKDSSGPEPSQAPRARSVRSHRDLPQIPTVHALGMNDRFGRDVLFVNPPSPNRDPYIRDIHRVGRNSREGTIWPQTSLAQLAAMFDENTTVRVVDCIAEQMTWREFEQLLVAERPRYYVTQATAPTLTNDMRGVFLAKSLGATTIAIGTHVSPATEATLVAYPALDFALRGEPEETLQELVSTLEVMRQRTDASGDLSRRLREPDTLAAVKGIAYLDNGRAHITPDRPFIEELDTLPIPRHELLPLERYRLPIVAGRYTFVVTSRGCPAGCGFCIKHVTYQNSYRLRSPEHIMQEVRKLIALGTTNIHFEADLFTINRDQVVGLCEALIELGSPIRWTCNSRVDFVDPELLETMGRAGCWMIAWGIESGSPEILRRVRKGIRPEQVTQALGWAKAAGIRNYGYFIIGLPGETHETIEQTIAFSKTLPLDFALFHIAVPYPGTPLWFEALEEGWLRLERWEDFDMYSSAVLEYPNLSAEELRKAAQRAAREWALRPGPMWTFVKELRNLRTMMQWVRIGARHLSWIVGQA